MKPEIKKVIEELHANERMSGIIAELGIDDENIEELSEFILIVTELTTKITHGMFMATCAVHERLSDASDIQAEIENKVKRYIGKHLADVISNPGKRREVFMRKAVLYTRDITQDALGVL